MNKPTQQQAGMKALHFLSVAEASRLISSRL